MADNATRSDFFRSLTDRGIDPYAPAGPDADDLLDMGLVACGDCDRVIDVSECHSACTDGAAGTCGDCHDAVCGDRECRS